MTMGEDIVNDPTNVLKPGDNPEDDPISTAIARQAELLAYSIDNPATLASKLQDRIEQLVGADAINYHLGIEYKDGIANVKVARVSPSFVALAERDSLGRIKAGFSWMRTTESGWKVAVGGTFQTGGGDNLFAPRTVPLDAPIESDMKVTLTVNITK